MKRFIKLFVFLCLTIEVHSALKEITLEALTWNFGAISKCVSEIIKKSLNYRPSVIMENGRNQTVEKEIMFTEIIKIISRSNIQQVVLEDLNHIKDIVVLEEADWIAVAYFTDCLSLINIKFHVISKKVKYLIVMSHYSKTNCQNQLLEIKKYVANYDVTFILENYNQSSELVSHKIVTFIPQIDEATCTHIVRNFIIINMCSNGVLKSNRIFPNKKPINVKKCVLNVGIGPLYPFGIIENASELKTFDKLNETQIRGSDIELVKIATKKFNASLNYYFVNKKEENPFGQNTFIPFILNGSLDICAGGFYRIYGNNVSYSGIYARQSIIWIYTADRKDKSWQNLVEKVDGLYIFVIYYIVYCCIWYMLRKFDNQNVSLIATLTCAWGMLVGADSLQDARSLKQKILNIAYLIMCLHLSAYVAGQLYSFYTISEPPERLDTVNDVMESSRPSYLIPASKYFVYDERYMKYANESRECYTFYDCFKKILVYKGVTIFLQGGFLRYQAETAVDHKAIVLGTTEHVLTVYYEMLIRKHSVYETTFQDTMRRLFESGITEKLYREAIGLTVIDRAKSANKNALANCYRCRAGCEITLDQLEGAYYAWLIGCGISCCVFVAELISKITKTCIRY